MYANQLSCIVSMLNYCIVATDFLNELHNIDT